MAHTNPYPRTKGDQKMYVALWRLKSSKPAQLWFNLSLLSPTVAFYQKVKKISEGKKNHITWGLSNFYKEFQVFNQKLLVISRPGQRRGKKGVIEAYMGDLEHRIIRLGL